MQPTQTADPNKKFYIALAVMGFIIIALAIAVIAVAVYKNTPPNDPTTSLEYDSRARAQRNTTRMDDLSRFLIAAESFQSNNNGKTPWMSELSMRTFVKRYIDSTCSEGVANGSKYTYSCSSNEFKDPDGKQYSFWILGSMNPAGEYVFDGDVAKVARQWPNDHAIMVVNYAFCGDEGKVEQAYGERSFAMLYVEEGGAIACYDNH